jgi:recombination protein RecR
MPGIGARTGERLAYHVQSVSPDEADRLVDAIRQVKASAVRCSKCFNISESDPCPVCSDPRRDGATLCVVERVRDLAVIESSGSYRGLYHVLGGHIAPLEDKHPENLTIDALERRLKEGKVREVIIATNPDTEGDATANFLCDRLARFDVTVSVLARGMPAGGQLEYAAQGTVAGAIAGRRTVEAK